MTVLDRRVLGQEACIRRLLDTFDGSHCAVPLLVLRLPEFAEIAWRDGKRAAQRIERATVRAFATAAGRIVRDGDLLVHDDGGDWFAVAMVSPARAPRSFGTLDARAALERIAAAITLETGRRTESGWWTIESRAQVEDFIGTRARALERGARERERYEFLATVGHELRTPLTSIRGYIETLLDDDVDPETTRRFLETARREALRLARLVDGMLEFSLLDVSPGRGGVTDLVQVVHSALDALLPIAREGGVALRVEASGRADVRIDADGAMHAVLNVVENGIKYAGAGGNVRVTIDRQDPFVCVIVDDDGRGVDPEDRERIFEYRLRGRAPQGVRGKGVGLAIVRTIAERAGGRVSVEESPLGGARFVVAFPATKAESEGAAS